MRSTSSDLNIPAKIHASQYTAIERDLIIHLDKLDNITTVFEQEPEKGPDATYKYPTHCAYVRDATNALPLTARLPPDHMDVIAINAFLRGLNVVRGIDHVVNHKRLEETYNSHYQEAQQKLKELLEDYHNKLFTSQVPDNAKPYFKTQEAQFHTAILKVLNSLNLTQGLKYPNDYADLLEHYRNLASLLRSANSYITKLKQNTPAGEVTYIETAHPITKKTDEQKKQIALMAQAKPTGRKSPSPNGVPDEKSPEANKPPAKAENFYSVSSPAFQEASAVFAPRLMRDDTTLGAQTRSTIAPTEKNAFVVHNQIKFPDGTTAERYALRTASIGYIGKGETKESRVDYAVENVKQLKEAAKTIAHCDNLYINLLLTNHFWNKQSTMIAISRAAGEKVGVSVSVVPINLIGVSQTMEIAPEVEALAKAQGKVLPVTTTEFKNALNKKIRTENASTIINIIGDAPNSIVAVGCASGQDRTGTALEISTINWTAAEFSERKIDMTPSQIAEARAVGSHNAMLATLNVPGSAGLKTDSIPDDYFSPIITQYNYRYTADSNKDPVIDYKSVAETLGIAQPFSKADLEKNYQSNFQKISVAHNIDEIIPPLVNWANAAFHYQKSKHSEGAGGMVTSFFRLIQKGTWAEEGLKIREAVNEIVQELSEMTHHTSSTHFGKQLNEIKTQIKRVTELFPTEQRGTVFTEIEKMVSLADRKINHLQSEQKVSPRSK